MSGKPKPPREEEREVLITGIAGGLGRLLARRLHRTERLVGVDRRPFTDAPKDIALYRQDYRKKSFENLFRTHRVKAVYHLAHAHNPSTRGVAREQSADLEGTQRLFEYCAKYGVRKAVLLSSANVYGALPTNDMFLREDAPLLGGLRFPQIRFFVELDMLGQTFFWKHDEIETVILRPVHILGPSLRNAVSNYFRLKLPPTVMGFDPMIQLIHEEDVIEALILCLSSAVRGIFNIAGGGALPLSAALKVLGKIGLPLPGQLVGTVIDRLYKLGAVPFTAGELDFARFSCQVDGTRAARLLGFSPRHDLAHTLLSLRQRVS